MVALTFDGNNSFDLRKLPQSEQTTQADSFANAEPADRMHYGVRSPARIPHGPEPTGFGSAARAIPPRADLFVASRRPRALSL